MYNNNSVFFHKHKSKLRRPPSQTELMAYEVGLFPDPLPRLLYAELIESYRIGGFHPVDIGDTFKADRYKIVRKLGHGQNSTVWLAQDTKYHHSRALLVCLLTNDMKWSSIRCDKDSPLRSVVKSHRRKSMFHSLSS